MAFARETFQTTSLTHSPLKNTLFSAVEKPENSHPCVNGADAEI